MFVLFYAIFLIIAALLDYFTGITFVEGVPYGMLSFIYLLTMQIPFLAVTIRRLHDTGHSAWWFFINLVPLVGSIWLLALMLTEGRPEVNQYGVNPKDMQDFREKDKTKSAAISLIVSSSIWIAILPFFIISFYDYDFFAESLGLSIKGILSIILGNLTPIALLVLGISLLCKNCKKLFAVLTLIVVAGINLFLLVKMLVIQMPHFYFGNPVFIIRVMLEILTLITPIALLALGLSMIQNNGKPTISPKITAMFLTSAGYLWIFQVLYNSIIIPIYLSQFQDVFIQPSTLISLVKIVVPVSFIVLASSLRQDKNSIQPEDERVIACKEEIKRLRAEKGPKIGFAIVNIVAGLLLSLMGSALLFENVGIIGIAILLPGLFMWSSSVYALYAQKKHRSNRKRIKKLSVIVLICFILSCLLVAFSITMAILSNIYDW